MKCVKTLLTALLILLTSSISGSFAADFSDLFGYESYFHPFVSLDTIYSDNIYKTNKNTRDDVITIIKPGIWLAYPGADKFNDSSEDVGLFQSYLSYNAEIESYCKDKSQNDINHELEAHLYYNGPGGFSVELSEKYEDKHDDIVEDTNSFRYTDNTFSSIFKYDVTEKIDLKLGYFNFIENYESRKPFVDRTDNGVDFYTYYSVLNKTSVFLQLSFIDIKYEDVSSRDNTETSFLAGVKWDITDKSSGTFKAGYLSKDYKEYVYGGDKSTLKLELDARYEITARSDISVVAVNKTSESDEYNAQYFETNNILTTYRHSISERFTAFFSMFYNTEDYNIDRKDTTFNFAPALGYKYNDLIKCDISYTYENVDSSGDIAYRGESYSENIVLFSISASL